MEGETPAQLPVSQVTEAQPPPVMAAPGQPIMYQMPPGQPQPVFVQVPAGYPATSPEGQPIQYYYVPDGQPVQPGQPSQQQTKPGAPSQPVHTGQPVYTQASPGYPVQQQQQHQQAGAGGFELNIDTRFLKSPLCFIKIAEFVTLLGAWASFLKYQGDYENRDLDEKANFFKGITIFCWVMVIVYLILYTFSFPKICKCNRPSLFTITSLCFWFGLFALLLACTGNLVPRAVTLGEIVKEMSSYTYTTIMQNVIALYVALAFGFLSCILFVVDMVLNYREFQAQREQEASPDQGLQGPPQRRVWDINHEYMQSGPVFNIKFAEMVLLMAAWVCIVKYFHIYVYKYRQISVEDSKADFFKGITIFTWVMVILLVLTVVFSFDKICSRSSPWTLMIFLFYIFMSILLIACCGNLTPEVVDYAKNYSILETENKPNILALFIGLGLGYISWIVILVDIFYIYNLYRQQRMQEFANQQPTGQPVVQQPAVVIMPQGMANQQVFQPDPHPGQQTSQYPGQQPITAGMPPPAYSQQPNQQPKQW